jgi:hypothetical protein
MNTGDSYENLRLEFLMETCGVVKELENLCLHMNSVVADRALSILCDYFDANCKEVEVNIPVESDFIFS